MNKYVKKSSEMSQEFNLLPFEERKKISRYMRSQQLLTIEQVKMQLKTDYEGKIRTLTRWQDNILKDLK